MCSSDLVEPSPTVEPTPTPTPEPAYEPIAAVTVTAAQLRDGSAAQAVAAAGGNALVVEMKGIKGRLAWQSQTELAASLWANAADDFTAQAVRELAQNSQLYLVARVQCFRDPLMASGWVGSLMTRGGTPSITVRMDFVVFSVISFPISISRREFSISCLVFAAELALSEASFPI